MRTITNDTYEARQHAYIEEHCPAPIGGSVLAGGAVHERQGSHDCNACADDFDRVLERQNVSVEGDDEV